MAEPPLRCRRVPASWRSPGRPDPRRARESVWAEVERAAGKTWRHPPQQGPGPPGCRPSGRRSEQGPSRVSGVRLPKYACGICRQETGCLPVISGLGALPTFPPRRSHADTACPALRTSRALPRSGGVPPQDPTPAGTQPCLGFPLRRAVPGSPTSPTWKALLPHSHSDGAPGRSSAWTVCRRAQRTTLTYEGVAPGSDTGTCPAGSPSLVARGPQTRPLLLAGGIPTWEGQGR